MSTPITAGMSSDSSKQDVLQLEISRTETASATEGILRSRDLDTEHGSHQHVSGRGSVDKAIAGATTTSAANPTDAVTSAFEIIQLSGEEARAEQERAAEKIRLKTRPMTKFNTIRRNINQALHHDEPGSGLEPSEAANLQSQTVSPEISYESSDFNLQEDPASGLPVDHTTANDHQQPPLSDQEEDATPKKDSKLISIEPPRLVDAETAPGDSRYFQGPKDPPPEGDFVYDFLYQHERGAFFLGTPNFSSKSLLPVDPDEWTNSNFETSAMDVSDFEVPDPSWEWVHKSWLVDMTGDVDEDGWEYAMTFHGSPWHGNYEVFRSFARRRRWLRLRKRKGKTLGKPERLPGRSYPESINSATWSKLDISRYLDQPSPFPDGEIEDKSSMKKAPSSMAGPSNLSVPAPYRKPVDLYKIMKKGRSDREKLAYLAQYVVRYPGETDDIDQRLEKYLNLLDYETSRREFLSVMSAYGRKESLAHGADQLQFYSDQRLLSSAKVVSPSRMHS
ncbi:hypothetical protein EMPS_01930 [Entomortierella parvispora]|uniref:Peroxin/Ferlin domain-containing protein n=1 Tax=Entomortierella parvispora TaxID=205924 RepID=A0A9P3H4H0_9FUNG|nr:hypothetical protein EMPS_01930 [Entomortierella parvispora]